MFRDSDKPDFVHVSIVEGHHTALGAWTRRRLVLNRNAASFSGSGKVQRDLPHIRCSEERKYVTRL